MTKGKAQNKGQCSRERDIASYSTTTKFKERTALENKAGHCVHATTAKRRKLKVVAILPRPSIPC